MKRKTTVPENRIVIHLTDKNLAWLQARRDRWKKEDSLDVELNHIAQSFLTTIREDEQTK